MIFVLGATGKIGRMATGVCPRQRGREHADCDGQGGPGDGRQGGPRGGRQGAPREGRSGRR